MALVLRVDKDKGYIDLSKRRVSPEDIDAIEERFNKSKTVHSIMRYCTCACAHFVGVGTGRGMRGRRRRLLDAWARGLAGDAWDLGAGAAGACMMMVRDEWHGSCMQRGFRARPRAPAGSEFGCRQGCVVDLRP